MTGWYILEVMRKYRGRRNDWVALLVDVDPDADDDYQPVQSPVGSISGGTRRAMMRTIMLRA
jgi:hypothetical protein